MILDLYVDGYEQKVDVPRERSILKEYLGKVCNHPCNPESHGSVAAKQLSRFIFV